MAEETVLSFAFSEKSAPGQHMGILLTFVSVDKGQLQFKLLGFLKIYQKVIGPGDFPAGFYLTFKAQIILTFKYLQHNEDDMVLRYVHKYFSILTWKGGALFPF